MKPIDALHAAALSSLLLSSGCGSETDEEQGTENSEGPLYLIGSSVQTTDQSTLMLWTTDELSGEGLDVERALEVTGGSGAFALGDWIFVGNDERKTITRYVLERGKMVEDKVVSFANRGLDYLGGDASFALYTDAEHAYLVNGAELEVIEWNPTTMKIVASYDIDALDREGWGNEFRGGYLRKSDGKLFLAWNYNNMRTEFVNDFVLGVFDTKSGELKVLERTDCPTSAAFGGFFDEQDDLYLLADSFGGYTRFGDYPDQKDECILRIRNGEDDFDPDYRVEVPELIGGRLAWGFYYLGDGLAFTSAIDLEVLDAHDSLFEALFAPEHSGWLIDLAQSTGRQIENLPPDGVGFASHSVDGRLFVPRSSGQVVIEDIMSIESTLYEIKADATAEASFSLPGYIQPILRVR